MYYLNSIDSLSVRFFFYLGGRGSEFLGLLNTTRKVINITQNFLSPSGDSSGGHSYNITFFKDLQGNSHSQQ
jgi:hypothetical protein